MKASEKIKKLKSLKFSKIFDLFDTFKSVLFLMIFVIIYYLFFAADRYVSSMIFDVRQTNNTQNASANGILSLLNTSSVASEDLNYLKGYIHSSDMLNALDEKISLKNLYSELGFDPFMKFKDDSNEAFLSYYQARTKVFKDSQTGLLRVEVEGFTPDSAFLIAKNIMQESERFINEISHAAAREQMNFAQNELEKYKERYISSQNELLAFQNKYGIFDPMKQAESKATQIAELESNLMQKEAELLTLKSYINDDAPQLVSLKAEISALKIQLEKERAKISSASSVQKLNDLAASFQRLSIEFAFAKSAYETALKSYEAARIESARKIKQLTIIQSPQLPSEPKYPRKFYNIITAFIVLSLIFGIGKFLKMIIQEHRY